MATRRVIRKVITANSTYIDPLGCDSVISYKIIDRGNRIWADMQLSDCERKIGWWFSKGDKESIAKIDKAIETLTAFRADFVKASNTIKDRAKAKRKATLARKTSAKS